MNPLRELRQTSRAAIGIHLSFFSPEAVEFYGLLGFEWLFLDAEHTPLNASLCRELVRAAEVAGMPCMVRVSGIDHHVIEGYLDIGVLGILAPHIATPGDAEALVKAVKFAPAGHRGAATKSRAASYGLIPPAEYCRRANQTTFTGVIIEDRQGLDNLESIIAVPGIDYVAIGVNDLRLSLSVSEVELSTVVEQAYARIDQYGKPRIAVINSPAQIQQAAAAGARLLIVPDVSVVTNGARPFLDGRMA